MPYFLGVWVVGRKKPRYEGPYNTEVKAEEMKGKFEEDSEVTHVSDPVWTASDIPDSQLIKNKLASQPGIPYSMATSNVSRGE